jgi:hypothetical protein
MSTPDRKSNTRRKSGNGWWSLCRLPKEPEAAEDLGLPQIAPYYPNRLQNCVILVIVLVVVIVAVSVGVVLSQNGSVANETNAPSIVEQFLANLPAYSINLAENDNTSPQANALRWLQNDPQYHDYRHVYRLNQRYAMAVLYFSTNGDSWNYTKGWLSNDNECSWYQYDDPGPDDDNSCVEASRLAFVDLDGNDLDGSIPTELELLTDLGHLYLYGEKLSGTIHSEL